MALTIEAQALMPCIMRSDLDKVKTLITSIEAEEGKQTTLFPSQIHVFVNCVNIDETCRKSDA